MRILLKLHYTKFDVSRLFCSNVIDDESLGVQLNRRPPPPLVKEGLKKCFSRSALCTVLFKTWPIFI